MRAKSEGEVWVGVAGDVKTTRIFENLFVTIARRIGEQQGERRLKSFIVGKTAGSASESPADSTSFMARLNTDRVARGKPCDRLRRAQEGSGIAEFLGFPQSAGVDAGGLWGGFFKAARASRRSPGQFHSGNPPE